MTPGLRMTPVRRLLSIHGMPALVYLEQRDRLDGARLRRSRHTASGVPSLDGGKVEQLLDLILADLYRLAIRHSVGIPAFVPTLHQLTTERDRTLRVQCIESPGYVGEPSVGDAFFSRFSR